MATSLDGYIAGPDGEIDWILPEPTVDFAALYAGFDTVLLGRRTRLRLTHSDTYPSGIVGLQYAVDCATDQAG